jgi:hypothetical protein
MPAVVPPCRPCKKLAGVLDREYVGHTSASYAQLDSLVLASASGRAASVHGSVIGTRETNILNMLGDQVQARRLDAQRLFTIVLSI